MSEKKWLIFTIAMIIVSACFAYGAWLKGDTAAVLTFFIVVFGIIFVLLYAFYRKRKELKEAKNE